MEQSDTRERGQTLVLFVFALATLMGFVALSIDIGLVFVARRDMQNAADAAALAGARELPEAAAATAAALEWAQGNGYADGVDGVTVQVVTPYNGDPGRVHVSISSDIDFVFGRAVGLESAAVGASAAAENTTSSGGAYAIIVLDETDCFAFDNTGSGNISIEGGGIMVNSSCSTALRHGGSGNIDTDVNHYYQEGGYTIVGSGNITPNPWPAVHRAEDPLAALVPPLPGAPAEGSAGTADDPQLTLINDSNDRTLYPGTYYGGLKIIGGNVTLMDGNYIMAGGGLEIDASGNVTGTDVMFYNTNDPYKPTGAGAYDRFKLTSSGSVDLSAPTSGPYAYMLFWQDPNNTQTFLKSSSGNLSPGVIYLPTATLDESSSGNLGSVQIIVKEYDKSGSGNVEMTSGGWVGESIAAVRLVE